MKQIQAVHHEQKGGGNAPKLELILAEWTLHLFKADADLKKE